MNQTTDRFFLIRKGGPIFKQADFCLEGKSPFRQIRHNLKFFMKIKRSFDESREELLGILYDENIERSAMCFEKALKNVVPNLSVGREEIMEVMLQTMKRMLSIPESKCNEEKSGLNLILKKIAAVELLLGKYRKESCSIDKSRKEELQIASGFTQTDVLCIMRAVHSLGLFTRKGSMENLSFLEFLRRLEQVLPIRGHNAFQLLYKASRKKKEPCLSEALFDAITELQCKNTFKDYPILKNK